MKRKDVYKRQPLSTLAEALLHTTYHERKDLGEDPAVYAKAFEADSTVAGTPTSSDVKYRCTICGYIYEGDITKESDDYKCCLLYTSIR